MTRRGAAAPAFVVKAYEPIAAGGALTICYGTKENAHLLVSYGFAQRVNPYDTASVRVQWPGDHIMSTASRQLWPMGLWERVSGAAQGGVVTEGLEWEWDDSMFDERPVDVDDALVLLPRATGDLALILKLARVKTEGELIATVMMGANTMACIATEAEAIRLACATTLAALPDAVPSAPTLAVEARGPIAMALQARRALLQAASTSGTGE